MFFLWLLTAGYDVFSNGDSWDLAYRANAGIGKSAYDAYINPQTGCVDPGCLDVIFYFYFYISCL